MHPFKAAGKGVIIPKTKYEAEDALKKFMLEKVFGNSGDEVVIEEVGGYLSLRLPPLAT